MKRPALVCAALLAAGALASCASHVHTPFLPGEAPTRPALRTVGLNEFDYADHWPHAALGPTTGEDADYRTRSLALPSVGENGQPGDLVTARYHQGKREGAKPLVIVLPIWGFQDYPPNTLSAGLLERGAGAVNVLQILGEQPLFDWQAIGEISSEAALFGTLDRMVERFVDTVIDIRRVVDWAASQPDVDPERIALVGFSMGALVASVALATEPRFAAGILVMGGADLHEILAACDNEVADARALILARLGWSTDRFKRALERPLAGINPARLAGATDPSRVLIIEAGADVCVPKAARERLWRAFGRPERITYRYGHRTTFLAMTFLGGHDLQRQVYRFLNRSFARHGDGVLLSEDAARPRRAPDPG